ncbi:Hypothetical protein DAL_124 [Psychrobacter phage D'Alembert]|nr:Hypothetical protein DAL_124 [Psychrobacter phage D'Alembert]
MPHFNNQYPSMEEIRQKRQDELEYENNILLKEQNELLRELLGKPKNETTSKPCNRNSLNLEQEYAARIIRSTVEHDLLEKYYNFKD